MIDPSKTFVNKELYGQSFDEFSGNMKNDFIGSDFEEQLEWAMLILQSKFQNIRLGQSLSTVSRGHFDKAYLMTDGMVDSLKFLKPFGEYQATPEMFPNLNIRTMTISDHISLRRVRELSVKDRRGLNIKSKHVFDKSSAFYMKDSESFFGFREGVAIGPDFFNIDSGFDKLKKSQLALPVSLKQGYRVTSTEIESVLDNMKVIAISYNIAMSMYYEWSMYIKEYDNIGLVIPISPVILKEIYTTSMVKFENKKRMIHFVKSHYRRKIAQPNEDYSVFVQRYLRGELKFDYKGFRAEIIPPRYDLNRINTRKNIINPLT